MFGWTGNILEIDLTRRQFMVQSPSAAFFHQWLGGKGIAGQILELHIAKPLATDWFTFSGKARIIKIAEDVNAVVDSLTACKFIFFGASLEEYARALYGLTGLSTTGQDLLETGERIYFQERILNALNSFSAREDDLPQRFFLEHGYQGEDLRVAPWTEKPFYKPVPTTTA